MIVLPHEEKARVVLTAKMQDAQKWLKTFPTHGDLFPQLRTTIIHYTANEQNEVALYEEASDLDWYLKHLQDPATGEALAADGVNRDSVRVFVLDREWHA